MSPRRPSGALLALLAAGCEGDVHHPDISPYESEWLGLYTIESWTLNESACDAEGPSIVDAQAERSVFVQACDINGEFLFVAPCVDADTCVAEDCGGGWWNAYPEGWTNLRGDDLDGWYGGSWTAPEELDGHCEATRRATEVRRRGDVLEIRVKRWPTGDYGPPKPEESGFCAIDEDAWAAIEGQPCAALEVLRIRLVAADCDPLASECDDDALCTPHASRFLCLPAASPRAAAGEDCSARACADGLFCAPSEYLSACTTPACCTEFCDRAAPAPDSQCSHHAEGDLCAAYYYEGWEQPGRESVGVCLPIIRCDGFELPPEYVCDGVPDCDDGSDEAAC